MMKWLKRWWIICALLAIYVVIFLISRIWFWKQTRALPVTILSLIFQVGVTAFVTVFVGVLAQNNSRDQATAMRSLTKEQDWRHRSSELMSHEAAAIDHLGSTNSIVCASAIAEMIWLIRGWRRFTDDAIDAGKNKEEEENRWKDRAQELIDLVYKSEMPFTKKDAVPINHAREKGISDLIKCLGDHLKELDFRNACLVGLSLRESNLAGIDFEFADLEDADFADAHLEGANFNYAELQGTVFQGAHLKGAHFQGANVSHTHFVSACLKGADLSCDNLQEAHLAGSYYDNETTFPDHFNSQQSGMKLKA